MSRFLFVHPTASSTARQVIACTVLALALCVVAPRMADAQTILTRPYEPSTASVEVVHPTYEADSLGLGTSAAFVTASYTLNENIEIAAELPVARVDAGGVTATRLGNPFAGFLFSSTDLPLLIELGVRLPVADGSAATELGTFADAGRGSAFIEEEFAVHGLGNTRAQLTRNVTLRLRGGGVYSVYPVPDAEGGERNERDFRLRYAAQLWREGDPLVLGLTFTGRATLTAPGTYTEKSVHHLAGTAILDVGRVMPGLTVGVPFNKEVRGTAGAIVSLSVGVRLPY
jgi:hypothetical protein